MWTTPCYRLKNWQAGSSFRVSSSLVAEANLVQAPPEVDVDHRLRVFFSLYEKRCQVWYPEGYVQWKFQSDLNKGDIPHMITPVSQFVPPALSLTMSAEGVGMTVDESASHDVQSNNSNDPAGFSSEHLIIKRPERKVEQCKIQNLSSLLCDIIPPPRIDNYKRLRKGNNVRPAICSNSQSSCALSIVNH